MATRASKKMATLGTEVWKNTDVCSNCQPWCPFSKRFPFLCRFWKSKAGPFVERNLRKIALCFIPKKYRLGKDFFTNELRWQLHYMYRKKADQTNIKIKQSQIFKKQINLKFYFLLTQNITVQAIIIVRKLPDSSKFIPKVV